MRGIDVSSNQHPGSKPIDWEAVADAGYGFVIVKATQGLTYVNPWAVRDIEDAFAAGLFVGAYHYFEVGDDPAAQAKNFISALIGQRLDMGTWLDWEPGELPAWSIATQLDGFLNEARGARPGIGVYCDRSWQETFRAQNVTVGRLWLADWGQRQPDGAILWQNATGQPVEGVPAPVDTDVLVSERSFNLASYPPPRPGTVALAHVPAREPAVPPAGEDGP